MVVASYRETSPGWAMVHVGQERISDRMDAFRCPETPIRSGDGMTPDWFHRAATDHRVIALHGLRNKLTEGRTYTIAGFVGQPDMESDFGPYAVGLMIVGNKRTVFDPRYFRPAESSE